MGIVKHKTLPNPDNINSLAPNGNLLQATRVSEAVNRVHSGTHQLGLLVRASPEELAMDSGTAIADAQPRGWCIYCGEKVRGLFHVFYGWLSLK